MSAGTAVKAAQPGPGAEQCLLVSKISVPDLPSWLVERRRIDQLIGDGARRPLTVVTGPPGAGKTVAIASWANGRTGHEPHAWMTVDRYDNQPETFWCHLVEALIRAGLPLARPSQICAQADSADRGFLSGLVSALAECDPPVVLVLDDIHLLTKPEPLDDLAYVVQHAGGRLRLIVASRLDPLLPLHRFRLAGNLTEVRSADLAFTVAEARALLAQHDISLSEPALQMLTGRAEGWAAGLRLAAISMSCQPDPDQFAMEFGVEDGAVVGYLVNEVLDAQPARIREMLLKTSILDRVNDDLAAELTGDREVARGLPALAEANAFVQPVGHGWYRYHTLFADVLRLKLRRELADDMPELHRRAARWLGQRGRLAEAVRQAAAAADWPLAARTVIDELAVWRLIDLRPGEPIAEKFRQMPADVTSAELPWLIAAAAMAVSRHRAREAVALLDTADGLLESLPDEDETPARLAAAQVRLALARQAGDLRRADSASARAAEQLSRIPDDMLRHPGARAQVLADCGSAQPRRGIPGGAPTAPGRSVRLGPRRATRGRIQAAQTAAEAAVPVITEQLSQREHEVLELVSGMLTTAEIADELYLSANTVKSHVRSILRKLGAARRGEAVRRARDLELLLADDRR